MSRNGLFLEGVVYGGVLSKGLLSEGVLSGGGLSCSQLVQVKGWVSLVVILINIRQS